jgi:hypothetical protein
MAHCFSSPPNTCSRRVAPVAAAGAADPTATVAVTLCPTCGDFLAESLKQIFFRFLKSIFRFEIRFLFLFVTFFFKCTVRN